MKSSSDYDKINNNNIRVKDRQVNFCKQTNNLILLVAAFMMMMRTIKDFSKYILADLEMSQKSPRHDNNCN